MRAGWIAAAAVALTLFMPYPYKIHCRCKVQAFARRYVSAPFEGIIEKSFVEPGEIVKENQLLAEMDGKKINYEIAEIEAEFNRAGMKRAVQMSKHETGAARIAQLEADKFEAKLKMLQDRNEHLIYEVPFEAWFYPAI